MRRLCLTLALLWGHAVHGQAVSVVDDSGRTIRLERPPQRVIALGPHLTEQLFAVGAGPQVVGVSRYSDFPAEARALRRAGLFHRLVQFWVRPLGSADTATDAATRLDILSRGGFPR